MVEDRIPIDKADNCERMLKTGQYQTNTLKDKEDWWLIYYLKQKYRKSGLTPKEIKDTIECQWKVIYNTRFSEEERWEYKLYIDRRFKDLYDNSTRVCLTERYKPITIYQGELDYINSLPVSKWIREFIFIFLGHCKTVGGFRCEFAPVGIYSPFLSVVTRDKDRLFPMIYTKLRQLGLWIEISNVTIVDDHKHAPEERIDIAFDFCFPSFEDTPVAITFDRQIDLLHNLNLITDTYVCENCGSIFKMGNKTQRLICDSCYKKQRQKRKNFARDQRRKTPM